MAIPHAFPGMPVDLRADRPSLKEAQTTALVKGQAFEAIRLVLPAGHEVCHGRQVEGPITVQCLEGRAAVIVGDETHELPAGYWLYLMGGDPHTLRGMEDSLVLLTILFPQRS